MEEYELCKCNSSLRRGSELPFSPMGHAAKPEFQKGGTETNRVLEYRILAFPHMKLGILAFAGLRVWDFSTSRLEGMGF